MESIFQLEGEMLRILVPKDLDHHNCIAIRETADSLILKENIKEILFDFKNTEFMDSSGIGVIIGRNKNIKCLGGQVSAININERIKKILVLSGLYKMIIIYEQEA